MKRPGDWGWWAFAIAGLVAVGLWNGSNFANRDDGHPHPRTKDLTFLPKPEVARILACGHQALAAKLRWIDSFDYFELQVDRKDDAVDGEAGQGFTRLYDILLALDPRFQPYYDQAALNLGAIESRHFEALGVLLRGLMVMPDNHSLWQQAAIELFTTYDLEKKHPQQMADFLAQWAAAEITDDGRRTVLDWKSAMGRRQALGLTEFPYWQEQLAHTPHGSSAEKFILATMQDLLARYGHDELQALADAYTAKHLFPPLGLRQLLDPELIQQRYPNGLPPWAPVGFNAEHRLALKTDPLGYPYELLLGSAQLVQAKDAAGHAVNGTSACRILCRAEGILKGQRRVAAMNIQYITMSDKPPQDLAEMLAVANPGPPPPGTRWAWREHQLALDVDPAPGPAWVLRSDAKP